MSASNTSNKFELSKDHDGYFKSSFAKNLINNNKKNKMYDSSVSLLNTDDLDIVSDTEIQEIHVQFGLQKATTNVHSFMWPSQSDYRSLLENNRRSLGLSRVPQGDELGGKLHTSIMQSEVESLRWRLKESEESRLIYRRSVQELARFLERAHTRMGSLAIHLAGGGDGDQPVNNDAPSPPSPSDRRNLDAFPRRTISERREQSATPQYREFVWRRPRRAVPVPRELDPALIADDALRLYRLATSLLQTDAPCLTEYFHQGDQIDEAAKVDHHTALIANQSNQFEARQPYQHSLNFNLHQLPAICCGTSTPERRKSSSSSTSSLGSSVTACATTHEEVIGIFSRAGSSQISSLSSSDESNSITKEGGECSLIRDSASIPSGNNQFRRTGGIAGKIVRDNAHIEITSISTENESGFSSMNSFHEIGLPLINSTMISSKSSSSTSDDSSTMIQNNDSTLERKSSNMDKSIHQRWDSVPVNTVLYDKTNERVTLKSDDIRVLWV